MKYSVLQLPWMLSAYGLQEYCGMEGMHYLNVTQKVHADVRRSKGKQNKQAINIKLNKMRYLPLLVKIYCKLSEHIF